MNVIEAFILVAVFFAAIYLTIQNFLATATGYITLINTRYELLLEAIEAGEKTLYKVEEPKLLTIQGRSYVITPYYACELPQGVIYRVASGYPVLLIDASYYGYPSDYYILVPSPSYLIHKNVVPREGAPSCESLTSRPAAAFLILPNGTVLIK